LALPLSRKGGTIHFSYLVFELPTLPTNNSKWARKASELKDEGIEAYNSWRTLPVDNMKRRIVDGLEKAKSMLDPHELVAAEISDSLQLGVRQGTSSPDTPAPAPSSSSSGSTAQGTEGAVVELEVLYPSSVVPSANDMEHRVYSTFASVDKTIGKYMLMYTLITPITFAMAVLPGPNIFFAANAMRIYSLWKCRQTLSIFADIKAHDGIDMHMTASDDADLNWLALHDANTSASGSGSGGDVVIDEAVVLRLLERMGIPHASGVADITAFKQHFERTSPK